ncbi:MAG: hypothetical protein ACM31C_25260 [Acidobacteriota bacterium]
MTSRGAFTGQRSPGPFHCVACQTYVTGTASGHCPRCGWVPPRVLALPEAAARSSLVLVLVLVLVFCVVVYQ